MKDKIKELALYHRAIDTFGVESQKWMLIEECGELLNVFAKRGRYRTEISDIITELADVHIMVEQMAYLYGWDEFEEERERKLKRLQERIDKKGGS